MTAHNGFPLTAWATVNALGQSTSDVIDALRKTQPAFSEPPRGTGFQTVCGMVDANVAPLPASLADLDSRNNRFIAQSLSEMKPEIDAALERWSAARVGICVGSSTAAMDEIESAFRTNASTGKLPDGFDVLAKGSADGLVRAVQSLTGIQGPSAVLSNACASSGKAFASAKRWLEADLVDAVLVGGADSLCQLTLRGFRALGLLAPGPSRPFGLNREGIHIGEGAAFCLMEREGEGPLFLGAGETADAHHMTTPDPEGKGARAAMHQALEQAGLAPEDIDYINAHGTGTRFNDEMEATAIRGVLGDAQKNPIVASTKGFVGHTLGAAGAIEAVFVLASLVHQFTPASLGAHPVDPGLPIQIATEITQTSLNFALSNSFAFGGSNVSLVFGAPQ